MRYAYLAVCLALLGALLSGCGGGSGTKAASRRAGTVVIHIVVPKRAAQKGRFIPSNTGSVKVSYTSIANDGTITPTASKAVTTTVSTTITLSDVLAGKDVTLTAVAYDGPAAADGINATGTALAAGSATVNLQPGVAASPTITLISGVVSLPISFMAPAPSGVRVGSPFTLQTAPNVPVSAGTLTWSALTSNVALVTTPSTGLTAAFTALKAGPAAVQVTYQETGTAPVTGTFNITVQTPTLTFADAALIKDQLNANVPVGNTNSPPTGAFALAGNSTTLGAGTGYALFNDINFPIPGTGSSRIARILPAPQTDTASFDPLFADGYSVNVNSRMAFLPSVGGNPAWAVTTNPTANLPRRITAFAAGSNAATPPVTPLWMTPPLPGNLYAAALDTESTTSLNVLEVDSVTGSVQMQQLDQSSGASGAPILFPGLTGFAPASMATILRAGGIRDVYLSNAASVAKLTLNSSNAVITSVSNFTAASLRPASIATSDTDPSYLYVLNQNQLPGTIYIFYTSDGTLANTIPVHGVVSANSQIAARQGWLYVLDADSGGTNAQIERYLIGAQ